MLRTFALGQRLWDAALKLLYPSRCAACDELVRDDRAAFCEPCAATLEPIAVGCPRCARPIISSATLAPPPCLGCLQRPPLFDGARAAYQFGGAVAEAIRRLKWASLPELAVPLGGLLLDHWVRAPARWRDVDLIIPVPLHRKRLRAREFNQAVALTQAMQTLARARADDALALADPFVRQRDRRLARIRVEPRLLMRVRDTPPQTGLGVEQRRRNVLAAFEVRQPARIRGRRVLLIDDVLTTGATADACAAALREAGAASVLVLTLGRAVP